MQNCAQNIDLADCSYGSCEEHDKNLIVYLDSWDNKTIKVTFSNVLKFIYRSAGQIDGVFQITDENPFLKEALSLADTQNVKDHQFKMFVIREIGDTFFFEVVAEDVTVIKE